MSIKHIDKVALVYVELPGANVEQDLFELRELVATAQGEICIEFGQKRNSLDVNTLVGSGKLQEISTTLQNFDDKIDVVIFSCPLNATQRVTLKKSIDCDIIDKIDLILDIFALRAHSAEGKKQVELAQLTYNLATKPQGNFSRQGAGIGTRGPGETMLETNRRLARARMYHLRQELKEIEQRRQIGRQRRQENDVFTVALVGYTNAGKSTLFNVLTNAQIYADDKLFATLDTTVRKLKLQNGIEILLCDTVGFIKDLPHQLLDAFKSTLVEAAQADLLLNVCDVSDSNVYDHIAVTEQTLCEVGATAPLIRVYNKVDKLVVSFNFANLPAAQQSVLISATTGKNVDVLLQMITEHAMQDYAKISLHADFSSAPKLLAELNKHNAICNVEYLEDGVLIKCTIRKRFVAMFANYIVF